MGGVAETEEQLHQRIMRARYKLLRNRIDLWIFVRQPKRRISQIDEPAFVLQQFSPSCLTGGTAQSRSQRLAARPPQFCNPILGRLHFASGTG